MWFIENQGEENVGKFGEKFPTENFALMWLVDRIGKDDNHDVLSLS